MQLDVVEVHSDSSHMFFSHGGFFGGPLEGTFHGFSDFVHKLNSGRDIDQHVGSSLFRSISPDLLGVVFLPFIFFNQHLGSFFGILFGSEFSSLDGV